MNNALKALVQGNPPGVFGARWAAIDALQVIPLLSERLHLGSRPAATHRQRWELELYEIVVAVGRPLPRWLVSFRVNDITECSCSALCQLVQTEPDRPRSRRHRKAAAPGPG